MQLVIDRPHQSEELEDRFSPQHRHAPYTNPPRAGNLGTGFLSRPTPPFGLSGAIGLILPPRHDQTGGDPRLERPRIRDEAIESAEQGGEFLGREKTLVAHTICRQDHGFRYSRTAEPFISGALKRIFAVFPASRLR